MMLIDQEFRKCIKGYKLTKAQEKINHVMYMDNIKLFAKKGKKIEDPNIDDKNIELGYRDRNWHKTEP